MVPHSLRDKQYPICLRLQEKAFENQRPRAAVKYSFVLTPPPVSEKLDPPDDSLTVNQRWTNVSSLLGSKSV